MHSHTSGYVTYLRVDNREPIKVVQVLTVLLAAPLLTEISTCRAVAKSGLDLSPYSRGVCLCVCVCVCVCMCVCVHVRVGMCVCLPTPCDSRLASEAGPRQFYCLGPALRLNGKVTRGGGGGGGGGNTWHFILRVGAVKHLQVDVKAMQMSLCLVREMI